MKNSFRILSLLSLLMFFLFSQGGASGAKTLTESEVKAKWKIIAGLEKKQQYNAAIPYVEEILAHAQAKDDAPLWAKALVRRVVLENALHGAGTSVKLLLETPWPKDLKYQAILNLYTAQTLFNYYQTYAWEINQREKTATDTNFNDLKKWTSRQIFAAINQRYELAWQYRELMGQEKVSAYDDYFTVGNYPNAIRKTLRDLIVYEWVNFLKNTTIWSPEQAQEIYKLPLASFLAPPPAGNPPAPDLNSAKVHPLEKIDFILNDHSNWFQASGQRESFLEARLVKLDVLTPHFTKPREIADIGRAYQELLKEFTGVSWWAHGQYQYASFIRTQGDLVTAHQVAKNGYEKYPSSIGGKECLALMKEIEAPAFSLRIMANDRHQARSAQISHRNLNRLYFRIYRIDPAALAPAKGLPWVFNSLEEIKRRIYTNKPQIAWESSLPDPGDYQTHQSYETLPIPPEPEGLYLIAASANRGFTQTNNQVLAATFCLSSLTMIVSQRPREGTLEVWVRDGVNGSAVPGAKVTLYQYHYQDQPRIHQAVTDEHGLATFSKRELDSNYYNNYLLIAEKGARFTILKDGVYLQEREPVENTQQAFVYTDRAIYRPLQKVYYKIVAFEGNPPRNEYQTVSGQQLTVRFTDPNGETVASQTVTTNSFGSASGEFHIPSGRILGYYRLVVDGWGETGIRVEEYKRPTFEAKLLPPDDSLRLNHDVTLKGEAVYYFGMPVTEGRVNYRITRETNYPWWYCWYYSWISRQPAREVAAGETSLNNKGEFQIHFRPEGDETLPEKEGVSYRFRVAATITDSGGETKEAVRDYLIGFTAISANISTAQNFYHAGEAVTFEVSRTNLEGAGQAGSGKYELYLLQQPEKTLRASEIPLLLDQGKHTPGDSLRPRWEEGEDLPNTLFRWDDGPLVRAGELAHDQTGRGAVTFRGLKPGAYRLRYQTQDQWGAVCRVQKELVVATAGMALRASHYLLPLKQQVTVGQSLPVLIGTGFQNKPWIFEVWRGDELARREYRDSDGTSELLQLPIDGQMRGGFTLRLYLVEDYQVYQTEARIAVPFDNKKLDVNFSTFRDLLRPGQKETWSLTVKGPDRESISAELLAYMYDRSLDYFGAHQYPSPATLYQRWGYRPALTTNLSANSGSRISAYPWFSLPVPPSLSDNRLIFYPNYPTGGLGRRNGVRLQSEADGASLSFKAVPAPVMAAPLGSLMKDGRTEKFKDEYAGMGDSRAEGQSPSFQTEAPLRSNFAETAFFYPHLLTGADGSVKIEFEVPETVTSWNVFVHALTRDLKFMTLERQTETRKELMVRPYLPRFFREGDTAALKVVVNNAGKEALTGEAILEIYDPETGQARLADFQLTKSAAVQKWSVSAGKSATLTWKLTAPNQIKTYAFKVMAKTSQMSDGEVRPVPVLPSRLHLVESRFGVLKDDETRVLKIEDLEKAAADPSLQNENLVVTLDGQLIYTVLRALPYLMNYPYECLEQVLNRFLSTSIVGSLYTQYPPLAKMARDFSSRKTKIEPWVLDNPNRKLALEEIPWLQTAKGGSFEEADLINLFDSRVVQATQESALQRLQKAQLPSGGFPWFEGGPASDYMTLYILYGLAKAREFDVTVPEAMIRRAWQYLRAQYDQYYATGKLADDYYFLGFLNYVASCFPESYYAGSFPKTERTAILNRCFKHWTGFNPYAKAWLALTLYRAKRTQDAKLVLASIMDSAVTKPDQGTFWAREDRSWLWYNDQIESHAFILRTLLEINPEDSRLDGLALWLLLNKKMNQWKSTRTTAEVIYSLAKYMNHTGSLAVREEANVAIGGQNYSFVFEPDQYTGAKNQLVFEGAQVKPEQMAAVTVSKKGKGFMFASMTWSYSTEKLPVQDKGGVLSINRAYYLRSNVGGQYVLTPLSEGTKVQVGDQIEVQLSITCRNPMEYVHLHDPRAAGLEPERPVSGHHWDLGLYWYEEVRDSGANFFFERLPQGEYSFKYRLRANMAGVFRLGPAAIQSMYAPEFAAFSAGQTLKIGE